MAGGEDGDWWRRQTEEGAPTRVDGGALAINEEGTRAINEGLGQGSFGFVIWDAALSLASFFRWLEARGRLGSGLRCLELGAGTGVPGLTLAQLGAGRVVMTDYDADVIELMERNVRENSLEGSVECAVLDWADRSTWSPPAEPEGLFDLVVAADVLYHGDGTELCEVFAAYMPPGCATVGYLGYRVRNPITIAFFQGLWRHGFALERLEDGAGRCVGGDSAAAAGEAGSAALEAFDAAAFVPLDPEALGVEAASTRVPPSPPPLPNKMPSGTLKVDCADTGAGVRGSERGESADLPAAARARSAGHVNRPVNLARPHSPTHCSPAKIGGATGRACIDLCCDA